MKSLTNALLRGVVMVCREVSWHADELGDALERRIYAGVNRRPLIETSFGLLTPEQHANWVETMAKKAENPSFFQRFSKS